MDYEIDIEEHDVLDNPVIKTIFPDISIIKKEITQYFEEEPSTKKEAGIGNQLLSKHENLESNDNYSNFQNDIVKCTQNKPPQPMQSNKIILGSKVKGSNLVVAPNNNYTQEEKHNLCFKLCSTHENNSKKLILGTKPNAVKQDNNKDIHILKLKSNGTHDDKNKKLIVGSKPNNVAKDDTKEKCSKNNHLKNVKLKHIRLILQDIKSYLNQNGRYCKQCCRLFLSKQALDIHKNKIHCNKIHKNKNIIKKVHSIKTQHRCSICGSYFSNRGNLQRHYKNIHQKSIRKDAKIIPETDKYQKFICKNLSNRLKETEARNEKKQITTKKTIQSSYKCNTCKVKLTSYCTLKRHYARVHNTKLILNTHKPKSKDLIVKTLSKENQEIESSIENYLDTQVNPKVTSYAKLNLQTADIEKREVIPARERERDLKHIFSEENLTTNYKPVVNDHAKKLRAENKLDTAKSISSEIAKYKESHQVLSTNQMHEIASSEENNTPKYVTRAKNSLLKDSNLCHHCKKVFPDQKSLVEHMYEILEPKRNSSELIKNVAGGESKKEDDKILFVCRQCSYYLPNAKAHFAHMIRNHKTEKFMEVLKEEFDARCKYCPFMSSDITTHNSHVRKYHIELMFLRIKNEIENDINNQRKNIETFDKNAISELNSFALESVLFKCNKCNICFLSSNVARHHKEHMDLLINWKCSICLHILKEQDKRMHLKQHSFSQPIKVLNLNETAIRNVLYNCTKCAIHFTEKRYQEHYPNCGSDTTDSSYCSICDILVDKMEIIQHKTQHEQLRDISDFTIIDSNIIEDTKTYNTSLKRKGINAESEVRPRKIIYGRHNCLTYCHTCKRFLSDLGLNNRRHIKGTCSDLPKYACDLCGLVFTSSTLITHKSWHDKEKYSTLQDYKFFDLQGKQISPPIPKYPHCETCKIHFLRKKSVAKHICSETDFLTCDICNIKLTEKTFKMHMSFHFYVIQRTQNLSWRTPNPSLNSEVTNFTTETHKIPKESIKNEMETHRKSVIIKKKTDPTFFETPTKSEENSHKCEPSESTDISSNVSDEDNEIADEKMNSTDLIEGHNTKQIQNDDFLVVLYTCKTCGVTFESYDEVIKHCHNHYSARENNITQITSIKKCTQCSLKFDSRFYLNHQRNVHSGVSKIKVLEFDPNYFTNKNVMWVKHVFQTLPDEIVKELLKNSIYQHEHRIQFESIQRGSTLLYVYKCDMCGNFIDPVNVYKHAENPCGKVRKHPCSICGLPFNSTFSRLGHEKLHKQIKGATKNSLNIILFNQKKDKIINNRIFCIINQYLLYQCRNCDRVAEKLTLTDHVCDRSTLVKCLTCGLLLSKKDLQAHLSKHTDVENFSSENFKVILFGCKNSDTNYNDSLKTLSPCFSGTVYDYTLYKCQICEICHRNKKSTENHSCIPNFDLDRSMCSECHLYFSSSCLNNHMKQHRSDPDFNKENIHVITFQNNKLRAEKATKFDEEIMINDSDDDDYKKYDDVSDIKKNIDDIIEIDDGNNEKDESSTEKATKAIFDEIVKSNDKIEGNEKSFEDCKNKSVNDSISSRIHDDYRKRVDKVSDNSVNDGGQKNSIGNGQNFGNDKDNSVEDVMDHNIDEHLEILYKCKCGLHFLDETKVFDHLKICQPKAKQYKQNCSKCHLLFNPSELFSHIMVHHRDKSQVHNFKVIEISTDKHDSV